MTTNTALHTFKSTEPEMIRPAIQAAVRCAFGYEGRGPASANCERYARVALPSHFERK